MYGSNAFGNPDGSRTDITEIMAEFISFDKKFALSGVAFANNLTTRVIVGAKGSGKTVYLKRLQALLKDEENVYVNAIEDEVPTTSLIVGFCKNYSEKLLMGKWKILWKLAILRAVISNILQNNEWNQDISENDRKNLLKYENNIFPQYSVTMTIYAEAKSILSKYNTKSAFDKYSEKQEWDEVESIVRKILKKLPPIYFFIDAIDEEYENAPVYWLWCQKGMFYRVMKFLSKDIYKDKLQIIICIRDSVMASICKSENSTRYLYEKHVRLLNWDYSTIKYFFETKIKNLKECYFICEGQEKTIGNWLSIDHIYNEYRKIDEDLIQYILRHTRLIPRDIVQIGNSLAELKLLRANYCNIDISKIIRSKVAECAKSFGNELLQICANQIENNQILTRADYKKYTDAYIGSLETKDSTSQLLKDILLTINKDRLTWEEIQLLEERANDIFGKKCEVLDILWQNGVLGYIDEGPNGKTEKFFNEKYPDFSLPKKKSDYRLRSCIIDAVGITNWDLNVTLGGGTI